MHEQGKSWLIWNLQRTQNPCRGLQKQMKVNKSLTLKLCQKKRKIENSSYDFGENEVLFVKNGARVLDL